jgi:hypothetical protein
MIGQRVAVSFVLKVLTSYARNVGLRKMGEEMEKAQGANQGIDSLIERLFSQSLYPCRPQPVSRQRLAGDFTKPPGKLRIKDSYKEQEKAWS